MHDQTSLFDQIMVYLAAVFAWFAGEAGRAMLAGAAGGLVRWFMSEKRRMRDAFVAVFTGLLFARYFTPVIMAIINKSIGDIGTGPDARDAAAFIAGIVGMGSAKLLMALVDRRANKAGEKALKQFEDASDDDE